MRVREGRSLCGVGRYVVRRGVKWEQFVSIRLTKSIFVVGADAWWCRVHGRSVSDLRGQAVPVRLRRREKGR